jgi:uncharacterized protein with ParB-like and HNH nuclease domain/predicted transport protein
MKANEAGLLDLIQTSPQFIIPIYQRVYSWTERECQQLWEDILRTGNDELVHAHFVGSIVYISQGSGSLTRRAPQLVIDGQQRLTTVMLLVAALAEALEKLPEEEQEPLDGFSPIKLREYYLLNPREEGEKYYKLLLSQTDRASLMAIVDGGEQPKEHSVRVVENYVFFRERLKQLGGDLLAVCQGLAKLLVVDVKLMRGQDNPQLIFESMNSTGRELSQADLIRNFVLMGLEPKVQTRLYQEYWRPMEVGFGQTAYDARFDGFMRHYLTLKSGEIPNVRAVYEAFKAHARSPLIEQAGVEELVRDVRVFARYYSAIALGAESDPELRDAFHDLQDLKVDVAYPFLLELYHDYANGVLSRSDFVRAVRLVEAYVFRRAVCAIPTNSLNKTFSTFSKALRKDRYIESIEAHLLSLPSYRRFPRDDEFQRDLKTRDLYNFGARRSYWLRRLENHGRKERAPVEEYTIEHILPQNPDLPAAWRSALGPECQRVQETWLHTLGNLTLTGYNSEYRDRPFSEKRDMQGGFRTSPLRLNQGLGQVEVWDEAAIRVRAARLADLAVTVWTGPAMTETELAQWRPRVASAAGYGINDHPFLLSSPTRELFEAFRREVLALDPAVAEEFLKLYVAYKAETNFVDVVPQAKRLRLSLNMPFEEIDDPRGLCRDVSQVGRWGNGDVEIGLDSLGELPYVIGLVRQALDRQLTAAAP